ncbi:hypothetical protein ACP70R_011871 [Stipagrostis hirtigluma subsp. patula]
MAKRRRVKTATAPRQTKRRKAAALALAPVLPLPADLVDEVFLRLPPRSLAVCRCVAPSWNHLLSSPAFADRYHAAADAAAASAAPRFVSVAVERHGHQRSLLTAPTETIPISSPCEDCPRVFCGAAKTCHGVFLLGRPCEGRFYACNPSTGGVLRLPPRRPPWYLHSAGLGYHAAAGEHKAVLLERVGGLPSRWWIPRLQCHVVTIGGGQQRWRAPRGRRAPIICKDALVSGTVDPVFAAGRLHWMLLAPAADATTGGEPNGILSFLIGSESFERVPPPPSAATDVPKHGDRRSSKTGSSSDTGTERSRSTPHTTLAELGGRLCMVRDLRDRAKGRLLFEVWKLHGYEPVSWSLDCRIDPAWVSNWLWWPRYVNIFPLRYVGGETSGESKKILLANTLQMAAVYDPDAKELLTVADCRNGMSENMRMVLYQESPVHIAGMEYGTDDITFTRF